MKKRFQISLSIRFLGEWTVPTVHRVFLTREGVEAYAQAFQPQPVEGSVFPIRLTVQEFWTNEADL